MNFYAETSWNLAFLHPNPDCNSQQKVFEKCEKVFPTTLCMNVSGLQKCKEQPNIDCVLRKKEFEECLKNGCPPDTCDKRTQYLTLCAKAKSQ
jgi:hypothetical protein